MSTSTNTNVNINTFVNTNTNTNANINTNINTNTNMYLITDDDLKNLKIKRVKISCLSLSCTVLGFIVMGISLNYFFDISCDPKYCPEYFQTTSIVTNYYTKNNNRCCLTTYDNICKEYSNNCINGYVTFNYIKNNTHMNCDVVVISNKLEYKTVYDYIIRNFDENSKHNIYVNNNNGECLIDDEFIVSVSAFIILTISIIIFIISILLCVLCIYYNRTYKTYKRYKTYIENPSNNNNLLLPPYTHAYTHFYNYTYTHIDRDSSESLQLSSPPPPDYNSVVNIGKETTV